MAEKEDIAEVVAVISAAYPHFDPTEHTVEVYWQTLKHYPADILKSATLKSVAEAGRKFAPTIGEIVQSILEINQAVNSIPSSYEAWQEVLKNFNRVGGPEWSHPMIASAVDLMGWRNLCMSTNQVADRARFLQAYDQLQKRYGDDVTMLPEVRGYIESGKLLVGDAVKQLTERMEK